MQSYTFVRVVGAALFIAVHVVLLSNIAHAGATKGLCQEAKMCRSEPGLLHKPNSKGTPIWTTQCGPNRPPSGQDPICEVIVRCPKSGGFGLFLDAVTDQCKGKKFDDYFGLDGLTFGVLHWTSPKLPLLLQAYQKRDAESYRSHLGALPLKMTNDGCLDPGWVCEKNAAGYLNCDPAFHAAFQGAITEPAFKKAELDMALGAFQDRISETQKQLGLQTAYGLVAMAVVKNGLRSAPECKPIAWKKACSTASSEVDQVDCMLKKYDEGHCRGGTPSSSTDRLRSIERAFSGRKSELYRAPDVGEIEQCSTRWDDNR